MSSVNKKIASKQQNYRQPWCEICLVLGHGIWRLLHFGIYIVFTVSNIKFEELHKSILLRFILSTVFGYCPLMMVGNVPSFFLVFNIYVDCVSWVIIVEPFNNK